MLGKIVRHIAGNYRVLANGELYDCRATGKFRYDNLRPLVGDRVDFDDENNYIAKILPRTNELVRPTISNVDQALIVTSVREPNFASYITNKLISLISIHGVEPVIVFTKCDFGTEDVEAFIEDYRRAGYRVITARMDNVSSYDEIKTLLKDKVTVIAGQTGAGKSTLINCIEPKFNLATQEISKALNRGKHTTRHTELHDVCGSLLADTPGFSSFELVDISVDELKSAFKDFEIYGAKCKFNNCAHVNEPHCEVKKKVEEKIIHPKRYSDYKKMVLEIQNKKEKF